MQVSKGLKRATGRGEQVQHHLGTLNFDSPLEFSLASPRFRDSTLLVCLAPGGGASFSRDNCKFPQSSTSPQIKPLSGKSPWKSWEGEALRRV
jgi:hypothetical protein